MPHTAHPETNIIRSIQTLMQTHSWALYQFRWTRIATLFPSTAPNSIRQVDLSYLQYPSVLSPQLARFFHTKHARLTYPIYNILPFWVPGRQGSSIRSLRQSAHWDIGDEQIPDSRVNPKAHCESCHWVGQTWARFSRRAGVRYMAYVIRYEVNWVLHSIGLSLVINMLLIVPWIH